MRATRRLAAPLAALILAAAPSTALAQNAGDEQYVDPFADSNSQSGGGSNGSSGSNGSGSSGSSGTTGSSGVAGTTAQATPSTAATTPSTSAAETTASSGELPRTGLDAGVVAAIGAALLLTGLTLRRRLGDARR